MMGQMMNGMGAGMGWFASPIGILVLVLAVLGAAALLKYLLSPGQ